MVFRASYDSSLTDTTHQTPTPHTTHYQNIGRDNI